MSVGEWLRFAELSLAAGWLGVLYVQLVTQPARQLVDGGAARSRRPATARLFVLFALLTAAQLALAVAAASGPLTPLSDVVTALLESPYGGLSLLLLVALVGAAVLAWRSTAVSGRGLSLGLLALLLICGAAALTAQAAIETASSAGPIVMSPTLTVPRSTVSVKNPYAGDAASAERGKLVYQQNCQVCHGIAGDGRGPAAENMRIRPASFHNPQHFQSPDMDGPHFWVIQHGDGQPNGMPAWQGTLTDQQIWDALNYVKVLSGLGTTPASSSSGR